MDKTVLVSIGHPNSRIPILPMVSTLVTDATEVFKAKKLRKQVAENTSGYGFAVGVKFNPSDLYWAIFDSTDDKKPRLCSDNYYWGVYGYESRGKNYEGISYYDIGYAHAKSGNYEPPENLLCKNYYQEGWHDYHKSMANLFGETEENEMLGEIS
jgi:hypothetical protein